MPHTSKEEKERRMREAKLFSERMHALVVTKEFEFLQGYEKVLELAIQRYKMEISKNENASSQKLKVASAIKTVSKELSSVCFQMGKFYLFGIDVKKDSDKALLCFSKVTDLEDILEDIAVAQRCYFSKTKDLENIAAEYVLAQRCFDAVFDAAKAAEYLTKFENKLQKLNRDELCQLGALLFEILPQDKRVLQWLKKELPAANNQMAAIAHDCAERENELEWLHVNGGGETVSNSRSLASLVFQTAGSILKKIASAKEEPLPIDPLQTPSFKKK